VSADPYGRPLDGVWADPHLSGDGRYTGLVTTDAIPGDTNGWADTYLRATVEPIVVTVTPDAATYAPGSSGTATITGSHLWGDSAAFLGEGVAVTGLAVADDSRATVTFTVAPGAAPGPRSLIFSALGTGPGDWLATAFRADAVRIGT
jgi:hypothetical protein